MRYHLGAAFAVAFAASATPALANVEVGMLECRGVSQQYVVASITNLQCLFRPSNGSRPQPYDAQIRRVGLDIGFNQSTTLYWSVLAPNHQGAYALSGSYAGASANATLGVGVGANALWGGSANTIALQPISGQSQVGFGVAGGVSAMDMRAHELPPRVHRGHRHRHRR